MTAVLEIGRVRFEKLGHNCFDGGPCPVMGGSQTKEERKEHRSGPQPAWSNLL